MELWQGFFPEKEATQREELTSFKLTHGKFKSKGSLKNNKDFSARQLRGSKWLHDSNKSQGSLPERTANGSCMATRNLKDSPKNYSCRGAQI